MENTIWDFIQKVVQLVGIPVLIVLLTFIFIRIRKKLEHKEKRNERITGPIISSLQKIIKEGKKLLPENKGCMMIYKEAQIPATPTPIFLEYVHPECKNILEVINSNGDYKGIGKIKKKISSMKDIEILGDSAINSMSDDDEPIKKAIIGIVEVAEADIKRLQRM